MRMFLFGQVKRRSLEVYGTEEDLEEAREKKAENRDKAKQKQFDKKVKGSQGVEVEEKGGSWMALCSW